MPNRYQLMLIAVLFVVLAGACSPSIREGDWVVAGDDYEFDGDNDAVYLVVTVDDETVVEGNEDSDDPGVCTVLEFPRSAKQDADGEHYYGRAGETPSPETIPCAELITVENDELLIEWDSVPEEYLGLAGYEDVSVVEDDPTPTPAEAATPTPAFTATKLTALDAMQRVFVIEQLFELTDSIFPVQVTTQVRVGDRGTADR